MEKCSGLICLVFNHPLRRWIIELLEANGSLSLSELGSLLNINLGRLCYHLENLVGLIEQDENQKYALSMEGKRALRSLTRINEGTINFLAQPTTLVDS